MQAAGPITGPKEDLDPSRSSPAGSDFNHQQVMIEIIMLAFILVMMARKGTPRRRAMGRYIRGNIAENLALGTLAANTLIGGTTDTVNERTLVSSIVASYTLSGVTPGDNVGPVLVGLAHGDYSDAEVEEWVENQTGWDEGDLLSQEISNRKIRRIGLFDIPAAVGQAISLNEGRAIKTKLNWILNQGQAIKVWAYNMGTAAFSTTDPNVHMQGHANLFPK